MKRTLLFLIAIMVSAVSVNAECSEADKKALAAFDQAWSIAGQKGDKAALMAIYADDYVGMPGMMNKTVTVDNAVRQAEREKANPSTDTSTSEHYRISCTPVTATITHRNTSTTTGANGKPEVSYSRSVHVMEKRDGRWQAVSNIANSLDDYTTLWYLEQDWNDAIAKRDRAWFEKTYASDFVGVSSISARVMNRSQDIDDTVNDKSTLELVETSGMNIRVDGNSAIVTGVFRTKGKDEKGVAFDRRSRYTDVWIKRDGRWQAWGSSGTQIPPSPPVVATN